MGKYKKLIEDVFPDGNFRQAPYDELVKCDNRVVKYLTHELLSNPNPNIRETCAEILRDRHQARAVPALIEALKDKVLFVRQDALWAIGPLCKLEPTGLETLLGITNIDPPSRLYSKVTEWWNRNKKYVQNNPFLW